VDAGNDVAADLHVCDAGADALATAPKLAKLAVDGPAIDGVTVALVPPFSPLVHDYYVRCAAGTNTFTVSLAGAGGAAAGLAKPKTVAPAATLTTTLALAEDDAIVATASDGTQQN